MSSFFSLDVSSVVCLSSLCRFLELNMFNSVTEIIITDTSSKILDASKNVLDYSTADTELTFGY